jgi:hypothetical protein
MICCVSFFKSQEGECSVPGVFGEVGAISKRWRLLSFLKELQCKGVLREVGSGKFVGGEEEMQGLGHLCCVG